MQRVRRRFQPSGSLRLDQQVIDVNWSQTLETVFDRSSIELVASSIETDRSSTLPLTVEIDRSTGFGVTKKYETPTASAAPKSPAIRHAMTTVRRVLADPRARS
jgi:hypothetical protein